jgi:hypothetical protein
VGVIVGFLSNVDEQRVEISVGMAESKETYTTYFLSLNMVERLGNDV